MHLHEQTLQNRDICSSAEPVPLLLLVSFFGSFGTYSKMAGSAEDVHDEQSEQH